ncbi:hypothetical protein [Hyphobacterium sp.]|uniref:hypothetical protein n=1 Tax=Hyphobacterium sp. TaxID=2004662 RepID=UPI003747C6E4
MKRSFLAGLASVTIGSIVFADADNGIVEVSQACETALALSAGTPYLQENAGVYVLGVEGYELVREGTNGYVCMAVREAPNAIVPQCFDRPAQRTQVQIFLGEGQRLRAGENFADIRASRLEPFETGDVSPVTEPGIVYMLSEFNLINAGGNYLRVAPHIMFHAPFLTMEDIASTQTIAMQNRGMPIIANPGPMSYLVSFVEHGTGQEAVLAACDGELPDLDRYQPFPPGG